MDENLKAAGTTAIAQLNRARVGAVGKLVENNTFTQKNAEKFGVLALNALLKRADKAVNGKADAKSVEEIQEKIKKHEEAGKKLQEKLAEAQGSDGNEGVLQSIIDFAGTLPEGDLDEVAIAKIKGFVKTIDGESKA